DARRLPHSRATPSSGKSRESLPPATDEVGRIIHRCAANDVGQRYSAVAELIAEVEKLDAPPIQPTA
ncbi:MAG: hypothetical protein LWW86_15900, partial [Micrococcales bacterium]|nr:hypothetical protein [Micrococcales bacterium]